MAPLTWREVSAPNFSGVSESQRLTANLLDRGLGGLVSTLDGFQNKQKDNTTGEFLSRIAGYGNDPAALDAALKSGTAFSGLNRGAIDPEALKYAAQRQGQLLDYTGKDLNNQGQGIANNTNQFSLDTSKRNDQQAQARLAAQPAAADLLSRVQTLAGSGNPADIEEARKLISGGTQTLLDAGWKADAIPGMLDAARTTGIAGFGYKKDVLADSKFWEGQGITDAAQKAAFDRVNANATPEAAIRSIQDDRTIKDPRIKAQAIQVIQQAAKSETFSQPDQAQVLLNSLGVTAGSVVAPGAGNALGGLLHQTEGAGNPDTLFGHSQRPGGRFEGVRPSTMTLDQLTEFDKTYGPWVKDQLAKQGKDPRIATPIGLGQIVGSTRRAVAKEMGLSGDTVFTAEVQSAMIDHIASKALAGPRTMAGKMQALRGQWEGFNGVPDSQLSAAITAYENGDRGALAGVSGGGGGDQAPAQASQAAPAPAPVAAPGITQPVGTDPAAQLTAAVMPTVQAQPDAAPAALTPEQVAQQDAEAQAKGRVPNSTLQDWFELPSMAGLRRDFNNTFGGGSADAAPVAGAAAPRDPSADAWFAPSGSGGVAPAAPVASEAAQLAAAASPATNTAAPAAPAAGTAGNAAPAVNPVNRVQTAIDQNIVDRVFNGNAALVDQVVNPKFANETAAQVANRLAADDGLMPGGNKQAVLQAINETIKMAGGNLSPQMAGALVANNAESRDLTSWADWIPFVPGSWVNGDRFSNANESASSATRTNMEGVANDLRQLGQNVDGSIDISKGVAQIENQRSSSLSLSQLSEIQTTLQSTIGEVASLQIAIQSGQDTPENRALLAQKMQVVQQLQAALSGIGQAPSPTTTFSRAANSVPQ